VAIIATAVLICLTCYFNIFCPIYYCFSNWMAIFAAGLYFTKLIFMIKIYISAKHSLLRFYPSFAAFTFPLVIASTAITVLSNRLNLASGVMVVAKIEWLAATLMIIYVFSQYLRFLVGLMNATRVPK